MKVKVEIITGFLGSGKTSFINAYGRTFKEEDKPYIIYLERGNKEIEDRYKQSYAKSLKDLEKILNEIDVESNKNILIEHNGTIELKAISDIFLKKEIRKKVNFYGVYFVGNYENLNFIIKNIGEILIPFIQSSKFIILNNYNKVLKEERIKVLEIIKEVNLNAQIIEISSLNNLEREIKESRHFKRFRIKEVFKNFLKEGRDDN